ncbi:phosphomevalonate kinase [Orbilia brochopaga]|uniref:Phosphomevalonate kinase n=1 Tax=Orbilia brochopaga TaxID=3140254 RepID=A0AAV9U399_9PEZI
MMAPSTAVSAPGKVLLAGGYTVLDPVCRGLVFALSARIHVVASSTEAGETGSITVRSPQFDGAVWTYSTSDPGDGSAITVTQTNSSTSSANPFVATAIRYALSYLGLPHIPPTTLTILADNDYYSQPPPPLPRFNNLRTPLSAAHKTGLGSSAALVTALTAALLSHLASTDVKAHLPTIHNLAQAAHCAAQGKVGSGFDVAAATYGSCQYQRFPPSVLSAIPDPSSQTFTSQLRDTVRSEWPMTCTPVVLPTSLGIVLGDVRGGSATPGMVRSVLDWRKNDADSQATWDALDTRNRSLIAAVTELSSSGDDISAAAESITARIADIRSAVRSLGEKAGVPIEPPSQTALLDAATASVEGVLGGVVPGAGGYDAVCFLYVDAGDTGAKLRKFLSEYQLENGVVRALDAREEREGVRVEDVASYSDVKEYFDGLTLDGA